MNTMTNYEKGTSLSSAHTHTALPGADRQAGGPTDIQAVGRTAQILALLGPHREHLTAQSTAELTKLNRTTAHRYLSSMEQAGILERDGSTYTSGPLLSQLSSFHLGKKQLMSVAPPKMAELVRQTTLTSALSVYGANGPVVVHVEENRSNEVLLTVPLGTQLDLFSAHAQVWFAFGADQIAANRVINMLPQSHRTELESLIEQARDSGLGLRALNDSGYVAVAAPIWSGTTLRATVAVVGTPILLPADRESNAARTLRQCAESISNDLGQLKSSHSAG